MIEIYGTPLSANYRKVTAVADKLAIEITSRPVNVYAGAGQSVDYLAVNPLGQIPTLVDGDFVLHESNAIVRYLARDSELLGGSVRERAKVDQWLFWESGQWQPALADVMAPHVGHQLLPDSLPKPERAVDWDSAPCARQLDFLDQQLKAQWLVGEHLTITDFSVAGMTTYFPCCAFPFARYPNIERWYRRMQGLVEWQRSEDPLWAVPGG